MIRMINPVFRREVNTSLRRFKIYIAISVYIAVIVAVAALYLYSTMNLSYRYGFSPKDTIYMYALLSGFQLCLVLITTPALTASSISGERERQTLDLLLMTKMTPKAIILGKLFSSIGIIILLSFATMPVFALLFYFGGVSLLLLLCLELFFVVVACMVGSISIFLSTVFKKTVMSMVVVYLIIGFLCIGTLLIATIFNRIYWGYYETEPSAFIKFLMFLPNPGIGFLSVIDSQIGSNLTNDFFNIGYNVTTNVSPVTAFFADKFWILNVAFNVFVTILFTWLATVFVKKPTKK